MWDEVPHSVFDAGDVASRDALDRAERRMSHVDRVDARTTDQPSHTYPSKKSYNGHDFTRSNASEALDHDPTSAVLMHL